MRDHSRYERASLVQDKGHFFRREGRRGRKGGESDTNSRKSRTDSLHFLCERKVLPQGKQARGTGGEEQKSRNSHMGETQSWKLLLKEM